MPGTATADKVIKAFLNKKTLNIKQYHSNGKCFTLYESAMAAYQYNEIMLYPIRDSNITRSTMKRLLRLIYDDENLSIAFVTDTTEITAVMIDGRFKYSLPAPFQYKEE